MKFALTFVFTYLSSSAYSNILESQLDQQRNLLEGPQTWTSSTWKPQLALLDSFNNHWVYLSGNRSCANHTACDTFNSAIFQEHQHRQKALTTHTSSLSFINCDMDPVLCHSWLLEPPALMHISGQSQNADADPLMRPIALPIVANFRSMLNEDSTDREQITFIMHDLNVVESLGIWDGFLNPFTGALGKYGGGVVWGWLKYLSPVPISQQTVTIGALALVRILIWKFGPTQSTASVADMILPPGILGHQPTENLKTSGGATDPGNEDEDEVPTLVDGKKDD